MNSQADQRNRWRRLDRRWLGFAAAGIAVLVAIAAVGPVLGPTETAAPTPVATAQSVPSPVPDPSSGPPNAAMSTPTPSPTPVAAERSGLPHDAVADSAAELPPTAPGMYASRLKIGTTVVAIDWQGIWTSEDSGENWAVTALQHPHQQPWCSIPLSDKLAFVDSQPGDASTVSYFDPALPGWLADTGQLPPVPESEPLRSDPFCRAITTSDGRLVFSTATDGALVFAVEQVDGSFQLRTVSFPDDWAHVTVPSFVSARTVPNGDTIAVVHCSYYTDTGCLSTYIELDAAVLQTDSPEEMTWTEAGGALIRPSENSAATVYADLGGSIDRGFEIIQLGDEAWAVELIEQLGSSQGPDFSSPVGRWAVGRVGTAPAPLGTGYWPLLTIKDGDIFASMVPLGDPSPAVAWGSSLDEGKLDADTANDKQWWAFDRAAHRWVVIEGNPTPTLPALHPEAPLFPPLRWSSIDQNQNANAANSPEVRSRNDFAAHLSPLIAGDRAFAEDQDQLWSSDDRGASWTLYETRTWGPGRELCGTATDAALAYVVDRWNEPTTLTIISGDRTVKIDWPTAPRVFMGDRGFSTCRPLRLNDQWWLAEIDHDLQTLRVTSTSDGEGFDTHTIDLSGPWRDALPGGRTRGTADLYYDEGWIVVRLCRPGDNRACPQRVDLRFDAGLLRDDDPTSAEDRYSAAALRMLPPVTGSGMSHVLHQVGDQLWSVELNTIEGRVLGHGGDARLGRYGGQLERVDGSFADVRLRNGQVMRCVYDQQYQTEPPALCETQRADGSWQPVLGTVAVDWTSVPAGTPVSFWHRTADGRILVVPS